MLSLEDLLMKNSLLRFIISWCIHRFWKLLQVEHLYSLAVNEMTSQCDNELAATTERQAKEISHLVSGIGEFSTEAEVNSLARHCEDQSMIQAKIDSQIDSMQEIQEWLDLMSGNHWSFHEVLYSEEFSM
ncbi:hypothetical protein ONE63_000495 [Megalurothrips usitatus]|uniref:Uncharacterized protein n=1 Tax=Megalurothrips usitatus TaxID=439358 RepID=A0AAV7Y153_9NEOP|nr:hypothetical protein ONE63_000495 [Megalurothrips usitatus]